MNDKSVKSTSLFWVAVISYGITRCTNISTLRFFSFRTRTRLDRSLDLPAYDQMMPRFWRLSTAKLPFCCFGVVFGSVFCFATASSGDQIASWRSARDWIDSGAVPEGVNSDARPETWSAVAILRLDRRVVGVGEATGTSALSQAVAQAITDARTRWNSAKNPAELDWKRLTLEIELGSPPEPLVGTSYAQAGSEVEPALEGIAVRRGTEWRVAHPATLQALNAAGAPEQTLLSLVMQHGLPAREYADIPASERVGLYRFTAHRFVQPTLDEEGVEVYRGTRVEPMPTPATAAQRARAAADGIARWFAKSIVSPTGGGGQTAALESVGLRGDYQPATDADTTLGAAPAEQALAAYALAKYANIAAIDGVARDAANTTSRKILEGLARVSEIEPDPLADPKAVGWIILAANELGKNSLVELPAASLVANASSLLRAEPPKEATALDLAIRAAALAALATDPSHGIDRKALAASVDQLWTQTQRGQMIGVLDWLLLADMTIGELPESHIAVARAARVAIARAQVGTEGSPAPIGARPTPRDVVGGFSLSGVGGRGVSAQSARPGHALALMLGEPKLTPLGEQFRARQMQIALVRFLRQLVYDDVASYLAPTPNRTLGALRTAPWNNDVAVAGNAMALLCLSESASALGRINIQLPSVEAQGTQAAPTGVSP